jgi:phage protein D
LSLLGAGLALVTGWLGGELVYQLGTAVDEMAHDNAPNSLLPEKTKSTPTKKQAGKTTR